MTTADWTLPGHARVGLPKGQVECWSALCEGVVGPPRDGDTISAWEVALDGRAPALKVYLDRFNMPPVHTPDCEFQDLPPSVHLHCTSPEALKSERQRLDEARYGS